MAWRSIGLITPSLGDWQIASSPTLGDTFRVSFYGDYSRKRTYLRIRQYFSSDEVSPSIRLYPKPEKVIFELPIPVALQAIGLNARCLGVAKFPYEWRSTVENEWSIELEEFY